MSPGQQTVFTKLRPLSGSRGALCGLQTHIPSGDKKEFRTAGFQNAKMLRPIDHKTFGPKGFRSQQAPDPET
jgi:hypothetical protein